MIDLGITRAPLKMKSLPSFVNFFPIIFAVIAIVVAVI